MYGGRGEGGRRGRGDNGSIGDWGEWGSGWERSVGGGGGGMKGCVRRMNVYVRSVEISAI